MTINERLDEAAHDMARRNMKAADEIARLNRSVFWWRVVTIVGLGLIALLLGYLTIGLQQEKRRLELVPEVPAPTSFGTEPSALNVRMIWPTEPRSPRTSIQSPFRSAGKARLAFGGAK